MNLWNGSKHDSFRLPVVLAEVSGTPETGRC
jgi:hypothetical protein